MPFTPFHLGPALFFGLLLFRYFDFPTFLVANVIVDLEPFLVLVLGLRYPFLGFFHSFLGGTVAAVALALVSLRIRGPAQRVMVSLGLEQRTTKLSAFSASLGGVYLHILLDSLLYSDIRPFYPLEINPFFEGSTPPTALVYQMCVVFFALGLGLYALRAIRRAKART